MRTIRPKYHRIARFADANGRILTENVLNILEHPVLSQLFWSGDYYHKTTYKTSMLLKFHSSTPNIRESTAV